MSLTTLKDDLLAEFREERVMINEQIELLDPLATSLRRPAVQRLLSSGTLILSEYICYIISIGGIASIAFMHKIYPFSTLPTIFYNSQDRLRIGASNLIYLTLGIYGIAAVAVILTFILGRVSREMRLKNEILYMAGKDIKTIIGQHLERKAALDTVEQRHMLGMSAIGQPKTGTNSAMQQPSTSYQPSSAAATPFRASPVVAINEIRNPGFD